MRGAGIQHQFHVLGLAGGVGRAIPTAGQIVAARVSGVAHVVPGRGRDFGVGEQRAGVVGEGHVVAAGAAGLGTSCEENRDGEERDCLPQAAADPVWVPARLPHGS